jgi:phage major head subunit gpT-like protein
MSLANKVSVFTTSVKSEFMTAYEAIAVPAQYLKYTTVFPSTGRFENYPFLSPVPGVGQYRGHRRVARLQEYLYTLVNLEYDSSFEILLRDIKDDQTGGYMIKARELAQHFQAWPGRAVLANALAKSQSTPCFDGSNYIAHSHTFGTGDNLMTGTAAASDGNAHNIFALVTTAPVKPLIWQQRMDPDLQNDIDSPQSKWAKIGRFWADMEGAAGFGRWHDAILMSFANTPTITELQTALGQIENRFRTFSLPIALDQDPIEYIHEQLVFSVETITFVVSSGLGNLFRQVLHQDTIIQGGGPVTNIYKGFGDLVVSGIVNTVS